MKFNVPRGLWNILAFVGGAIVMLINNKAMDEDMKDLKQELKDELLKELK